MIQSGDSDWIIKSHPLGIDSGLGSMATGLQKMLVLTQKRAFYLAASHRQIKKSLLCVLGVSAVKILFWTRMSLYHNIPFPMPVFRSGKGMGSKEGNGS